MEAICDYYHKYPVGHVITADYLRKIDLPPEITPEELALKLSYEGLITYKSGYKNLPKEIRLTDSGRYYLDRENERKERELQEERRQNERMRKQFRHDWKIAFFSAIAGAFLSRPIWSGIEFAISLFTNAK